MKKEINPLNHKNYISFLIKTAANTTAAQKIKSIYKFLRKYILAGRIFRYTRMIFTWLSAGTYFILTLSSLLIIIPLIIVSFLIFLLITAYKHGKYNTFFKKILKDSSVCIVFKDTEENIEKECENCKYKIFVIKNPFTGLAVCAKRIRKNVYVISMSYFYSLKRKVLDQKIPNKIEYNNVEVNE